MNLRILQVCQSIAESQNFRPNMHYSVERGTGITAEQISMRPEEGRMYVFPRWLEHGVEINKSAKDRVSISFNVLDTPLAPPGI